MFTHLHQLVVSLSCALSLSSRLENAATTSYQEEEDAPFSGLFREILCIPPSPMRTAFAVIVRESLPFLRAFFLSTTNLPNHPRMNHDSSVIWTSHQHQHYRHGMAQSFALSIHRVGPWIERATFSSTISQSSISLGRGSFVVVVVTVC